MERPAKRAKWNYPEIKQVKQWYFNRLPYWAQVEIRLLYSIYLDQYYQKEAQGLPQRRFKTYNDFLLRLYSFSHYYDRDLFLFHDFPSVFQRPYGKTHLGSQSLLEWLEFYQ